jgi:hypothetical protein
MLQLWSSQVDPRPPSAKFAEHVNQRLIAVTREMQHPFLLGEDQMINSKIARSEKDSEAIWRLRKLNPSS